MRDIPLSVYREWPSPDYESPITRGNSLLFHNIVGIIAVTFCIGVRLYFRVFVKRQTGIDDAMIAIAYIFTIGMAAVVLLANRNFGWDRHLWDVPVHMIQNANIIAFVAKIMFTFASSFTRLSLIFLYYRLIRDSNLPWYSWTLHISLASNIAILVSFLFLIVFQCTPVQSYWIFPTIEGHYMDEGPVTLICGILSCVADLQCAILPIPAVMRLAMPLRQRIGVSLLLSAGIIVTVCGAWRTYFICKSLIDTYDETWFTYQLWICAALEVDIAVICACIPSMKSVLWKPLRRWTSTMYYSYLKTSATRDGKSGQLCSQDPIVTQSGQHGYHLDHLDFEDAGQRKYNQDPSNLEKAIAQLPNGQYTRHPHHVSIHDSADDPHQSSKSDLYKIHTETSFQVSTSDSSDRYNQDSKDLPTAPPAGQLPHRPRHIPLMPLRRKDGQDDLSLHPANGMSTRRNAPAALATSFPGPQATSQYATSPLDPPTPEFVSSGQPSPATPPGKRNRYGGTFFFG